jgi:hypothetical protein
LCKLLLRRRGTYVGESDGADDLAVVEAPETQSVGPLDAESGLQDGDGDDKVRGQDNVVLPVDVESVRGELLSENVELDSC